MRVSELPLANMIVPVEAGARQEVCQNVVDAWSVSRPDREVVSKSETVELAQKAC